VGSNPATPTIFPNDFSGVSAALEAAEMSGKRSVSESAEPITAAGSGDEVDRRAWIEIVGTEKGRGVTREPAIKLAPMALERSIEPLPTSVDIESLKSKLLHHATREIHDPSDDMISRMSFTKYLR
jgi:hypothetical protein